MIKLTNVHELLAASDEQQPTMLIIDDPDAEYEVQLMVEAGLVEATLRNDQDGSFTAIHRLTDLGRLFLSAFKKNPVPSRLLRPTARYAAGRESAENEVLRKWNANFALEFHWPSRTN